jgi:ATP-binding protein involved in chromosome partitioning
MTRFRTYNQVGHETGSRLLEQVVEQGARLKERLDRVGTVVAVASGKGGVGKSAVTANLAALLARDGLQVGVVDADLNGPSLGRMLGTLGARLVDEPEGIVPAKGAAGVRMISMELLQESDDAPLRWREPGAHTYLWQSSMEASALREFLGDVAWGKLDLLLVDVPPGTDKIRRLLELVPGLGGVLVVTTPGELSRSVVARSLRLIQEAEVPVVGLVSNMSGYLCPDCGGLHALFPGRAPQELSARFEVPIWGAIPFDPRLGASTDRGHPWVLEEPEGAVADAFRLVARRLCEELNIGERP